MTAPRIHDLPEQERPRERVLRLGIGALSNAELIGILLRTGLPGENAVAVGGRLERVLSGLNGLARAGIKELMKQGGLGPAKAVELAAAFELGLRAAREETSVIPVDTPQKVFDLIGQELRSLRTESLRILLLNTRQGLMGIREVSHGTVNESLAHPREVFLPAVQESAYGIILVHNHPSGDPSPSESDRRLTMRLSEVSGILQIPLIDHIIIGSPSVDRKPYFSFREAGIL